MLSNTAQSPRLRRSGDIHSRFNLMPSRFRSPRSGFTLVELLTVIAIIGILSAITFGVVKGVNERAAIGQAKAELGTLAQALEAYKRQYGDYPQAGSSNAATTATSVANTNSQYLLFNALTGALGPKCDVSNTIKGKSFVDVAQFSLLSATALPTPGSGSLVSNAFIDPWGRLYWYAYKSSGDTTTWKAPGYVLLSSGPDGTIITTTGTALTNGIMTQAFKDALSSNKGNPDNIYSNEQ